MLEGSHGAHRCQDGPERVLRHGWSLQLMNSLRECLLVAAVGAQLGPRYLICIIVVLRCFLVELVLTFGHCLGCL